MRYESKLAGDVKSHPSRFYAQVQRTRYLKQRDVVLPADDGAAVADSPNMVRTLANVTSS